MLNKGFIAQEQTRSVEFSGNREIKRMQMGYSQSKMRRQQQRASEYHSGMSEFKKLFQKSQDDDIYNSKADNEAEKLESALDKEKRLQVKRKAECQKATEARDKQTVVS